MAIRTPLRNLKSSAKSLRKAAPKTHISIQPQEIGAAEFKAKCLAIIDQVGNTGKDVIITKRGKPVAKLVPCEEITVSSLFDRMKGLVEIVGDPDELINPVFLLEDWESLR